MTAALVTDLHFGARNDSDAVRRNQRRFWNDVFFPTIRERGVDEIVVLGDVFDKRRTVNFLTLNAAVQMFFEPLEAHILAKPGRKCRILVGNHDSYYRDRLGLNALDLERGSIFPNAHRIPDGDLRIVSGPAEDEVDGRKAVLLPWICAENEAKALEMASGADPETVLFAHLELKGFEMQKGLMMKEGMDASAFGGFKSVYSGHYHQPSKDGNVRYLGAPYEMTWADAESDRGFWIWDGAADKLDYVRNPHRMHHIFDLENKGRGFDRDAVEEGNIVRIVVGEDTSMLDDAVAAFEAIGTTVDVVHRAKLKDTEGEEIDLTDVEDTRKILIRRIQSLELNADNMAKLEKLFDELYERI